MKSDPNRIRFLEIGSVSWNRILTDPILRNRIRFHGIGSETGPKQNLYKKKKCYGIKKTHDPLPLVRLEKTVLKVDLRYQFVLKNMLNMQKRKKQKRQNRTKIRKYPHLYPLKGGLLVQQEHMCSD